MVKLLPAQRYAVQYTMNQLEKSSGIKIVINTYLNGNGLTSIYEEDFENRKTHFSEDHVDFSMNNNVLYFKDFDSNTIFYKDQIRFKFFVIKDLPEKINWKLINEYKTILGYTCQKASCHFRGRLFDVYFSTDLPISDGP
jgi:GLPGLI family protein